MSGPDSQAWEAFVAAYTDGTPADGVVMSVVPFGAFVRLSPGVDGLLPGVVDLPVGRRVTVRVIDVDHERRRFALAIV